MEANAHVNSVIVEYVEGIQVVKAFSQGERSYQKFANAVRSFRDFTMDWFRCTWASMNLCLSIPVSYTHLDVYKRQTKRSITVQPEWMKETVRCTINECEEGAIRPIFFLAS